MRYIALVLAIETRYCFTALKKKASSSDSGSSTTPRRRRRHAVQYLLIFVGCVLVIDALVGDKGLLAMIKVRQEYRTLERSLADAKSANAQLREQARRLREDPDAIEDIARRELGLMKPGEKLFIVKDIGPADQKR